MGRLDWNDFQNRVAEQEARGEQRGNGPRVGYFSLKNDGEEAIVRFCHDTPEDFELLAVHTIRDENGRMKNINCIRSPKDPIDMCPMCEAGEKVSLKIFIHLIQYERGEDGKIVGKPKIWSRSSAYAKKLAGLMTDYGSLKDCIFKVRRSGAAGSKQTDYSINFQSERVYPESVYTKEGMEVFDTFTALGNHVADKSYEDMFAMVNGGEAQPANNQASVAAPTYSAPAPTYQAPAPTYQAPAPTYQAPAAPVAAPVVNEAAQPVRTYQPATVEAPSAPRTYEPATRPTYVPNNGAPTAAPQGGGRPRRFY